MRFFLDSANLEEITQAWNMGVISGVTTNPSLVAKEGKDFHALLRAVSGIVNGPISAEVIALDFEGMLAEARILAEIHPNIVVKVPMTEAGLAAVKVLTSEKINTNVTLVFSAVQALLAARAGATYVSPFLGRDTKVIAASIRNPVHVTESARIGADCATVPFNVLRQLFKHPLTDAGIEKFLADWKKL